MSIERFREAQNAPHAGFREALEELQSGGKRGHWIWYVFPQLEGLGTSSQSRYFGVRGEAEAAAYIRDDELRTRLLTMIRAVVEQRRSGRAKSLRALMGSEIDAAKLVSSLTLFEHVAGALHERDGNDEYGAVARAAADALTIAGAEGLPPCAYTLTRLKGAR